MKQITVNNKTYATDGNWYKIEFRPYKNDDQIEYESGFMYNGNWETFGNYINTLNNAWNNEPEHYAAGLHARDITSHYKPNYIELNDTCEAVRIWQEV